jgi:hypothetical protein
MSEGEKATLAEIAKRLGPRLEVSAHIMGLVLRRKWPCYTLPRTSSVATILWNSSVDESVFGAPIRKTQRRLNQHRSPIIEVRQKKSWGRYFGTLQERSGDGPHTDA